MKKFALLLQIIEKKEIIDKKVFQFLLPTNKLKKFKKGMNRSEKSFLDQSINEIFTDCIVDDGND